MELLMDHNVHNRIHELSEKHSKNVKWKRVFKMLAVFTLLCTVYALIIPAITLEGTTYCGIEEHIHDDSCWEMQNVLICENTDEDHMHNMSCYAQRRVLVCGIAAHQHNEVCFAEQQIWTDDYASEDKSFGEASIVSEEIHAEAVLSAEINEAGGSSDLSRFISGIVIKDTNGTDVNNGGTVYVGQKYSVTLNFAEHYNGLQMDADTNGKLTYQIPAALHTSEESGEIKSGDNVVVGTYEIGSTGLLTLSFYHCDLGGNTSDNYFFDNYQNTVVAITFDATVEKNEGSDTISIDLGENISVDLQVKDSGILDIHKAYCGYDYSTHRVTYEVTVSAVGGNVDNVTLSDEAWYTRKNSSEYWPESQTFVRGSLHIFDDQDHDITSRFTAPTYQEHSWCDEMDVILGTVPSGQTYRLVYETELTEDIYGGNSSTWIGNGISGKGTNGDGAPVKDYSEDGKTINFRYLSKSGVQETADEGDVIHWTVTVGDKTAEVGSEVLTDTLQDGQQFTGSGIVINWMNGDNVWGYTEVPWTQLTGVSGNSFSLQLPVTGSEHAVYYKIEYKSTYPDPGAGGSVMKNTVHLGEHDISKEGEAFVIIGVPDIDKESTLVNTGDALHYEITVEMPAGMDQVTPVYLLDEMAFWTESSLEDDYYVDNPMDNLTVIAVGESGTVYSFTEDGTGEHSFHRFDGHATGESFSYAYIVFNTLDDSLNGSHWDVAEKCTLTVSYDVPFSALTGPWSETTDDYTMGDLLKEGYRLYNYADIYFGDGSKEVEDRFTYTENTKKEGAVNPDGTITYTVKYDPRTNGGRDSLIPKGSGSGCSPVNIIFHDDFDERLEYISGSLELKFGCTWEDYAMFTYQGTEDFDGSIDAELEDFVLDLSRCTFTGWHNVDDAVGYLIWFKPTEPILEYSYKLRPKDGTLDVAASVLKFTNSAGFHWEDGPDIESVDMTVDYDTKLLVKTHDDLRDGDKLDYHIELNSRRLDLLQGSETIQVADTMSGNLSLYWNSVKVYYDSASPGADPVWVDFDSPESIYSYSKAFSAEENRIILSLPDEVHLKIDYTTLITESGNVAVENTVELVGYGLINNVDEAVFNVSKSGGSASAGNLGFTLLKTGENGELLPGASFALYVPNSGGDLVGHDTRPEGLTPTVKVKDEDGHDLTLYYYHSYTTGADGSCYIENQYLWDRYIYALVEIQAPEGYEPLEDPVVFSFNPNAQIRTSRYQQVSTMLSIRNELVKYILPETGGRGTAIFCAFGSALILGAVLTLIVKKRFSADM